MTEDTQFQDHIIAKVHGKGKNCSVTMDDGWSFGVGVGPVIPRVGQSIRLYGRGIGSRVRGLVIDGHTFFYRTEAEDQAEFSREVAQRKLEKWEAYKAGLTEQEAAIAALPPVFQRRLKRFMENAPETAWESQGYELAACQAALAILATCDTEAAVQEFYNLSWAEQITRAPELNTLGISGNQFGMACRLAHWYLTEPENVWKEHAAISIITGCETAGCPPVVE